MRSPRVAVLLLTLLMSTPTFARQAAGPAQAFGTGIDLVQVDVSVLDKNRRPVRGLTAADFTLLEDGKPRTVAAFSVVDLPARPTGPKAVWMRDVASDVSTNDVPEEGRLVVILMDRSIPIGLPAGTARSVARAAIDQLAPGDLAAVVYTGSGAPQDFTSDRARLLAAIGDNPSGGISPDTARIWQAQSDQLEADLWEDAPGVPRHIRLPAYVSGDCNCGICVLDAIRTTADAVRDLHARRKSLLFIGTDIITDIAIGNVLAGRAAGNPANDICYYPVLDARNAMFRSLDLASLTVHAFDVSGVESNIVASSSSGAGVAAPFSPRDDAGPTESEERLSRQGHLAVLPDRTGGRTVKNTNSPADRVPDVFRESESYYLLGFEPAATDGREHAISVKVNRSDVAVRSRRAYVADPPPTNPSASVDRLRTAITDVVSKRNGITLTANALAVAASTMPHAPTLVVALHARHEASKEPIATESEEVQIVTGVFTMDGRPVATSHQTIAVTPRSVAAGTGITYDVLQRMAAKPGRYALRIGVDNPARRQSGSVYAFVEIPAFDKTPFTWSDIGLSSASATPAAKDHLTGVMPAPPVARRDFGRQERVTAFISAYHVSGPLPAPLEVSTRIVDERNRERFRQNATLTGGDFAPSQAAAYKLDLPLATLEPGQYLLTMENRAGKAAVTRQVRFTVR